VSEYLQTELLNTTNLLLWTKTKNAEHGRGKPKPIRLWEPRGEAKAIGLDKLKETLSMEREIVVENG